METTITISPFTFYPECGCNVPLPGHEKEEHYKMNRQPITYWGIYMDGENISYTSTRELADKTKVWMEKWLEGRL